MKRLFLLSCLVIVSACAATPIASYSDASRIQALSGALVLAPVRADVVFVTSDNSDRRDDWSAQASSNLLTALQQHLQASGIDIIMKTDQDLSLPEWRQVERLKDAVVTAISTHANPLTENTFMGTLPNRETSPARYTLGADLAEALTDTDAKHVLFLTSHVQVNSLGVKLANAMFDTVSGMGSAGPTQSGSHLVLADIKTGDILWIAATQEGDPRQLEGAATIVEAMLRKGPLK